MLLPSDQDERDFLPILDPQAIVQDAMNNAAIIAMQSTDDKTDNNALEKETAGIATQFIMQNFHLENTNAKKTLQQAFGEKQKSSQRAGGLSMSALREQRRTNRDAFDRKYYCQSTVSAEASRDSRFYSNKLSKTKLTPPYKPPTDLAITSWSEESSTGVRPQSLFHQQSGTTPATAYKIYDSPTSSKKNPPSSEEVLMPASSRTAAPEADTPTTNFIKRTKKRVFDECRDSSNSPATRKKYVETTVFIQNRPDEVRELAAMHPHESNNDDDDGPTQSQAFSELLVYFRNQYS